MGEIEAVGRKKALIRQVVDGENRPRMGKAGLAVPQKMVICGNQSRLPVVEVKYGGKPVQSVAEGIDSPAISDEPFRVVLIIPIGWGAVQVAPVVELVQFEEIKGDPGRRGGCQELCPVFPISNGQKNFPAQGFEGIHAFPDTSIEGHEDANVTAEFPKGRWERTRHIG
jgi:hypothetical protein